MSNFSPAWAYQTSHPYPQYYGDARYPGNSVMATTGKMTPQQEMALYGVVGAAVLGGGVYFYFKSLKGKKKKMAVPYSLGLAALGAVIGVLVQKQMGA